MDFKFIERLKLVIGSSSVRSFALKCEFSDTVLRKYLAGSEPSRPALIAIANVAGVSLSWLATGEGEMYSAVAKSYSKAKELLLDIWFDYRKNDEERFWGKHYPPRESISSPSDDEEAIDDNRIVNIDDQPDMTIAGTVRKFVHGYNRGMFGMGLIPDWVFTLLPSLSESDFEKWVREELKHRIEAGLPPIQEIIPLDELPRLKLVEARLAEAVTNIYGKALEGLPPQTGVSILRASIYPTLVQLGANDTRPPEIEEIEVLLNLAIRLGAITAPCAAEPDSEATFSPEEYLIKLDNLKQELGIESDSAITPWLGISRQTLMDARSGKTPLPRSAKAAILNRVGYFKARNGILRLLPSKYRDMLREFDNKHAATLVEAAAKGEIDPLRKAIEKLIVDNGWTTDELIGIARVIAEQIPSHIPSC